MISGEFPLFHKPFFTIGHSSLTHFNEPEHTQDIEGGVCIGERSWHPDGTMPAMEACLRGSGRADMMIFLFTRPQVRLVPGL